MNNLNVYMGTENTAKIILKENGVIVPEGVVNKVSIWVPGVAFADGTPKTFDNETHPGVLTLVDNSQAVSVKLGLIDSFKNKGRPVQCFLTVFDAQHLNGIAWSKLQLTLNEWYV